MTDDRARFEALFRAHYSAVTKYAIRRVGPDAAQEIVAETFLVAWRRLDDLPAEPLPWLYGCARRVIANERRRLRRSAQLEERLASTAPGPVGDPADGVVERVRVRTALDRLSERDQETLRLVEWEQLRPADAARVLGCSVPAFHVRLHRARRRVEALLREDEAEHCAMPAPLTEGTA